MKNLIYYSKIIINHLPLECIMIKSNIDISKILFNPHITIQSGNNLKAFEEISRINLNLIKNIKIEDFKLYPRGCKGNYYLVGIINNDYLLNFIKLDRTISEKTSVHITFDRGTFSKCAKTLENLLKNDILNVIIPNSSLSLYQSRKDIV